MNLYCSELVIDIRVYDGFSMSDLHSLICSHAQVIGSCSSYACSPCKTYLSYIGVVVMVSGGYIPIPTACSCNNKCSGDGVWWLYLYLQLVAVIIGVVVMVCLHGARSLHGVYIYLQ
jgi:predicted membrane channel-forming protein YqfA (hemolysin III family)